MIISKQDLKQYIHDDLACNTFTKIEKIKKLFGGGRIYFFVNLRKLEYAINNKKKIVSFFRKIIHKRYENKMHCQIPPNVFGRGLCLEHPVGIIVNPKSRIGNFCNIHQFVTIGNNGFVNKSATIGDNCYFGANCCVIGEISIGSNCIVGAGAVVTHSFGDNVVLAGVPARVIKCLVDK